YLADSPEFDAWRLAQADRFYRQIVPVLEALARHYLALDRYDDALHCARRLLEMEPWRETPHRLIMWAYAAMGQPEMALRQWAECRCLLAEELGAEPDAQTAALAAEIKQGGVSRPPAPVELTPFVGREEELLWLKAQLIDPERRLLTLAGPGGMGKTRLAQAAAARMARYFAGGVCFVSLAEAGRPADPEQTLLAALADGLEMPVETGRPLAEQAADFLRDREMLLTLDNFEEMATAVGLVLRLLDASPRTTILITSRARLNCPEETAFHLEGLPVPPPDAGPEALAYPSVRLFLERARRYLPRFQPEPDELAQIGQLCRLTEGMPLALLLAATWVEEFSCAEIVTAARQNKKLLGRRGTGILPRQRSVQAVFEHSWAQLSPAERETLARLSLFAGAFGREAATAVAAASPSALSLLAAKSMVEAAGRGRYRFHPLLRQMAADKLAEMGDTAGDAAQRYAAWYAAFLQAQKEALSGAGQLAALAAIRREAANARQAWRLALDGGYLESAQQMAGVLAAFYDDSGRPETGLALFAAAQRDLAAAGQTNSRLYLQVLLYLAQFLERAHRYDEAVDVLRQMLAAPAAGDTLKADGHYRLGCCLMRRGELEAALDSLAEAERCFSRLESDRGMSLVFSAQGGALRELGRYADARRKLELSVQLRRETGSPRMLAMGLSNLGFLLIRLGEYDEAIALLEECLALERQLGHEPAVKDMLINLSLAYANQENWSEARDCLTEALEISRRLEDEKGEAICLNNLGDIAASQGAYEEAVELLQASLRLKRAAHNQTGIPFSLVHLGRAYLGLGRRPEAREALLEAERRAEALSLRPLWLACQVEIGRLLLAE
ncbi:MAG TPA: tetratricopeptide repeat protein, partial [Anaerolineae bacterium]|nr:tetratricopeptide repeat protein [Anaerolineae bacterium]